MLNQREWPRALAVILSALAFFRATPAPGAEAASFSVTFDAPEKWGAPPPDGPIVIKGAKDIAGQPEKLNRRLHGTGHSDLQAPPVFIANFGDEGRLTVNASGYCRYGARIEISDANGNLLLGEDLPARKTGTDGQEYFVKIGRPFTVAIPAGAHRISVDNTGRDWIMIASYTLDGLVPLSEDDAKRLGATVVDVNRTFQTIQGWGGNIYPFATRYAAENPDLYDQMFKALATTHMRVRSYWHELERTNDNDDPDVIDFEALKPNDKGLIHDEFLMLQEMKRRGVKPLFAVFNSPDWIVRMGKPADWKPEGPKARLDRSAEPEFVESMAAYLLYARKVYGVTYAAVSVQNEPSHGVYTYQSPESLFRITKALDARLKKEGYETTFYCPDLACPQYVDWAQRFFSQEGAKDLSCCVSYHSYRRTLKGMQGFRDLGKRVGLPVWVTEQNYTSGAPGDRFEWSHAMKNAVCLYDLLVEGDAALSLHWSYVAQGSKGLVMYQPEKKAWPPTYDMLKHFYNTIPPGSVRVAVMPGKQNKVSAMAFLLPDKRNLSVVFVNERGNRSVDLVIEGFKPKAAVARTSDATRRFEPVESVDLKADRVTVRLPPVSVTSVQLRGACLGALGPSQ
jgi:O-glycosyl hydrolase